MSHFTQVIPGEGGRRPQGRWPRRLPKSEHAARSRYPKSLLSVPGRGLGPNGIRAEDCACAKAARWVSRLRARAADGKGSTRGATRSHGRVQWLRYVSMEPRVNAGIDRQHTASRTSHPRAVSAGAPGGRRSSRRPEARARGRVVSPVPRPGARLSVFSEGGPASSRRSRFSREGSDRDPLGLESGADRQQERHASRRVAMDAEGLRGERNDRSVH